MSNTSDPLRVIGQDEPPRDETVVAISQASFYYFAIAVAAFVAGFIVAWITFSTTQTNAQAIRDAANVGAREAVQTEIAPMQATNVAILSGAVRAQVPQPTPVPLQPVVIDVSNSPSWGPANAPVTIIEYSEFQCPFCAQFFRTSYPLIKEYYKDKVRFVFKHFPLPNHPDAEPSGVAAECAREQNKFWEFHDITFTNANDLSRAALVKYATSAGVANIQQFTQCLDSGKYVSVVLANYAEGEGFGVNGTPTFFINGLPLVGAQPFSVFKARIDAELAKASAN